MIQVLRRAFSRKASGQEHAPGERSPSPLQGADSHSQTDPSRKQRADGSAGPSSQRSLPISIHPDPAYYVETKTSPYARVRRVIDVSDGGVIGITGERGAGKSVLLNTLISDYSKESLTVNLSAPISSSREMEFFLMLFRHLTQRVITELRNRLRTNQDDIDAIGRAAIQRERRRLFIATCTLMLVVVVGSWSFYGWKLRALRVSSAQRELAGLSEEKQGTIGNPGSRSEYVRREFGSLEDAKAYLTSLQNMTWPWLAENDLVFTLAMAVLTVCGVLLIVPFLRRMTKAGRSPSQTGLLIYSERLAGKLDYELTRSVEQAIEFAPLSWLKGSSKRSNQGKARGLSLPELTADYIDFVSNVLRVFPGKLIICIDELDKVTDLDQVRYILREIKGALYVKGTFYILSISNDALRSFEGRLGDQRDIFESTFDDVFVVRPLDLESSMRILSNRLEHTLSRDAEQRAEPGVLATIAVFSAGNARDLIRGFRECALRDGTDSPIKADDAWKLLFSRRLESIIDRVAAVTGVDEPRAKLVELIENKLDDGGQDGSSLASVRAFRTYISEYIMDQNVEKDSLAVLQRFMRYLTELEILLCARERVVRAEFGEGVLKDASTIMKAYQVLPFSYTDAELVLAGITPVGPDKGAHVHCPTDTVKSLQQPVADRNIASSALSKTNAP